MTADVRFLRQILVAEIGDDGQAALGRSVARVAHAGLAGDVARTYAERAGFASVEANDEAPVAPAFVVDAAARAVVEGALSALDEIRRVVAR